MPFLWQSVAASLGGTAFEQYYEPPLPFEEIVLTFESEFPTAVVNFLSQCTLGLSCKGVGHLARRKLASHYDGEYDLLLKILSILLQDEL